MYNINGNNDRGEKSVKMDSTPRNLDNGLYKSLSAPTYSIAEASRLTGIGKWSVGRWLRGYRYEGGKQGPVIRRSIPVESTYASFLDLIDLLFVKKLIITEILKLIFRN